MRVESFTSSSPPVFSIKREHSPPTPPPVLPATSLITPSNSGQQNGSALYPLFGHLNLAPSTLQVNNHANLQEKNADYDDENEDEDDDDEEEGDNAQAKENQPHPLYSHSTSSSTTTTNIAAVCMSNNNTTNHHYMMPSYMNSGTNSFLSNSASHQSPHSHNHHHHHQHHQYQYHQHLLSTINNHAHINENNSNNINENYQYGSSINSNDLHYHQNLHHHHHHHNAYTQHHFKSLYSNINPSANASLLAFNVANPNSLRLDEESSPSSTMPHCNNNNNTSKTPKVNLFTCDQCGRAFNKKRFFLEHMKTHCEKPYKYVPDRVLT